MHPNRLVRIVPHHLACCLSSGSPRLRHPGGPTRSLAHDLARQSRRYWYRDRFGSPGDQHLYRAGVSVSVEHDGRQGFGADASGLLARGRRCRAIRLLPSGKTKWRSAVNSSLVWSKGLPIRPLVLGYPHVLAPTELDDPLQFKLVAVQAHNEAILEYNPLPIEVLDTPDRIQPGPSFGV